VFCDRLRQKGFQYGATTDESKGKHSSLVPYGELPEDEKEQNRMNVKDIPAKLTRAGYLMRPTRSHELPFNFPGEDLEKLSIIEHERWMNMKLSAGWQYAPKTDKSKKLHQSLVPWDDLPAEEKHKDRELVRGIPKILAKAGFAIEKTG
jgi:hypothetical protein